MDDAAPATAPPRRRRRWLRRLGWAVAFFAALVVVAPLALGIPPIRRFVAARVSDAVGRRVTIGGITASWWGGLEVRNLEVHNPDGWTGDPLLSVDRIKARVGLWAALGGRVDATVEVDRPVVTLVRGPGGSTNADGLGRRRRRTPREEADEERARERRRREKTEPRLFVRVKDGALVAHGAAEADPGSPDRVEGIEIEVETRPDGAKSFSFKAVARKAGRGGADVGVEARAALDAKDAGPVEFSVPSLDLGRLAKTLDVALGVRDVTGEASAQGRLTLAAGGGAAGRVSLALTGVSGRRGDASFSLRSATAEVSPAAVGEGTRYDVRVEALGLRAVGLSSRDAGVDEPQVLLAGTVVRSANGDLRFGDASSPVRVEARAVSGTLAGSVRGIEGDAAEADAEGHLTLALSPSLGRMVGLLASPQDDLKGTVDVAGTFRGRRGRIDLHVGADARDLVVGGARGAVPYREPAASLAVEGAWDGPSRTLTLSKGVLAAGAVSAAARAPFTITLGDPPSAQGDATVDADLARLSSLRAVVPSLENLAGGRVHGDLHVDRDGDATVVTWSVRGTDVALAPSALSSRGYAEREVVASGRLRRPRTGPIAVSLTEVRSALLTVAPRSGTVTLRLQEEGPVLEGEATASLDLRAAGTAFDKALGLRPAEVLGGTVEARVAGATSARGGSFDVRVTGHDLLLPRMESAGSLEATATVRTDGAAGTTTVEKATVHGFGLDVQGDAVLAKGRSGLEVRTASASVQGDLAAARPLVALGMAMPPGATLAGTLSGRASLRAAPSGRALTMEAKVRALRWTGARDPKTGKATTVDEPEVAFEATATLDAEPGLVQVEAVRVTSTSLRASVAGSVRTQPGGPPAVDVAGTIDGDAALIAARLRRWLGKGYEDTDGAGRVAGRVSASGPTAQDGRDLRLDADLSFARFSSGGVSLEDGRLTVSRPTPATPATVAVASRVNGGTFHLDGSCDLGRDESPWSARITIRGLDTGPIATARGAGHFLTYVLPAIVPADATSSVLSGRMDADIDLRSASIRSPRLEDTLQGGPSTVHMGDGEVRNSTLFSGLASGGKGLGALLDAVPGLGREFDGLSKALLFRDLSSRFTVGGRKVHLDPVLLSSPSVDLRFTGDVDFDGRMDLRLPLRLGGEAGKSIEPYVPDRTIPLKVTGRPGQPVRVVPDLSLEHVGKDLLDELFGGRKKKKPK